MYDDFGLVKRRSTIAIPTTPFSHQNLKVYHYMKNAYGRAIDGITTATSRRLVTEQRAKAPSACMALGGSLVGTAFPSVPGDVVGVSFENASGMITAV